MHYAVDGYTIVEICVAFLPMNALCRIVEIGCTFSEIRADVYIWTEKGVNTPPPVVGLKHPTVRRVLIRKCSINTSRSCGFSYQNKGITKKPVILQKQDMVNYTFFRPI